MYELINEAVEVLSILSTTLKNLKEYKYHILTDLDFHPIITVNIWCSKINQGIFLHENNDISFVCQMQYKKTN